MFHNPIARMTLPAHEPERSRVTNSTSSKQPHYQSIRFTKQLIIITETGRPQVCQVVSLQPSTCRVLRFINMIFTPLHFTSRALRKPLATQSREGKPILPPRLTMHNYFSPSRRGRAVRLCVITWWPRGDRLLR